MFELIKRWRTKRPNNLEAFQLLAAECPFNHGRAIEAIGAAMTHGDPRLLEVAKQYLDKEIARSKNYALVGNGHNESQSSAGGPEETGIQRTGHGLDAGDLAEAFASTDAKD